MLTPTVSLGDDEGNPPVAFVEPWLTILVKVSAPTKDLYASACALYFSSSFRELGAVVCTRSSMRVTIP